MNPGRATGSTRKLGLDRVLSKGTSMSKRVPVRAGFVLLLSFIALATAPWAQERNKPQTRPHGQHVVVPVESIEVDDGDTFTIAWATGDKEIVRILGIDTPEIAHPQLGMPQDQEWGREARTYALGALAFADLVELARADILDPYGRTLGFFYIDNRNYSVAVIAAHLAEETVTHYGDNGFPEDAKAVQAAAAIAGKPPFESPYLFRRKAREAFQGAGKK
jgi:endonuclease YncB( thermonuclease family)